MPGITVVSASNIQDATGSLLTAGTIIFKPVSSLTFGLINVTNTGPVSNAPVSAVIRKGAFRVSLADTSLASPANFGYAVSVTDDLKNEEVIRYQCIQPFGANWSLDTFVDNQPAMATIQNGPSAYDVAVRQGFVGTPAQWLVSLTGPMGQVSGPGMATAISKREAINLVALSTLSYAVQISASDGTIAGITGDTRYYATDYFVVPPGGTVIANASGVVAANYPAFGWAFYDYNLTYISGSSAAAGTAVSVPTGAVYGRFSGYTVETPVSNLMILANTATTPAAYVYPGLTPEASQAVTSGASNLALALKHQTPINLFDPGRLQLQVQVQTGNGQLYGIPNDSRWYATDYFVAPAGGTLICNAATQTAGSPYPPFGYAFYDAMFNYITGSSAGAGVVVQVPSTAVWARFSGFATGTAPNPDTAQVMVLPNTAALPSTYVLPGMPIAASATIDAATALTSASLPAFGKKWYHVGDSISAIYGGGWLPGVVANTGIVQVGQDAHTGRPTQAIFEYYGLNSSGSYTGPDPVNGIAQDPTAQGVQNTWADGVSRWTIGGKTLPQVLTAAAPDLITIYLGTNDNSYALGSLSDPVGTASEYGYIKTAIEGYMKALPTARLMWIAPYKNTYSQLDAATDAQPLVEAIKNVCRYYGVPVLDLDSVSGVNPLTFSVYLQSDNLHPNGNGDAMLARRVSAFINSLF